MRYDDVSEALRAFIGTRECFRKIGFKADDLFCMLAGSAMHAGKLSVFVQLQTKGKEFAVVVAHITDADAFQKEYEDFMPRFNGGELSDGDIHRMVEESEVFEKKVEFLLALEAKGIQIPIGFS